MANMNKESIYQLAPGFKLQWEKVQNSHVLLYPEGMVKINASAAAILSELNGIQTVEEIVNLLVKKYGETSIENDIYDFIEVANEHGWIKRK